MSRVRTFIAIEPGEPIQAAGEELAHRFSKSVDGVRWVQKDNIHLTLKFLGDVEDRELHSVCKAAANVAKKVKHFSLAAKSVGAFPSNEKPSTIWIGATDKDQKLNQLHSSLEDALADIGFPVERRPFKGHLTLGRARSSRGGNPALSELIEQYADHEFGVIAVKELVVFSSELSRTGPTYTTIGRCPLA